MERQRAQLEKYSLLRCRISRQSPIKIRDSQEDLWLYKTRDAKCRLVEESWSLSACGVEQQKIVVIAFVPGRKAGEPAPNLYCVTSK
jgi:hypothetical protein